MIKRLLTALLAFALLLLCGCEKSYDDTSFGIYFDEESDYSKNESKKSEDSSNGESSKIESSKDESKEDSKPAADSPLRVHFINVEQGDSIFIEMPNGKCMLIDSGEWDYAGRVITFIDCLGYKKIDYLIATHPHSDHIGGMQRIIDNFDIGKVYMPDIVTDTTLYLNLLKAIEAKGKGINLVSVGKKITIGDVWATFVAPKTIVEDFNNCSAVLHLTYGEKSFLFTGDAEMEEELTITDNIDCDVLKVGHHGSYTSSCDAFLKKASPEIAIISCGKGNEYGHPHDAAINRLKKAGVEKIYRTDISGTITVSTGGKRLTVKEGTAPSGYKWVLNISGKKLHTLECDGATEMKTENRAYSKRTLAELKAHGYVLCGNCNPTE